MDSSPRDHQSGTCAILCLSEMLDGRHVASSGASGRHRIDQGFIGRGFKSDGLIFFSPWTARDRVIFIGWLRSSVILATHMELSRSQDCHQTTEKARGRTPRSRCDRTAITVRSLCDRSRDRGSFSVESEQRFPHVIGRRSTDDLDHDRCTIAA